MTKSQWLREADIFPLLAFVWSGSSPRKRLRYQCGGCRHIAHLLYDQASEEMVEVCERFAEGEATEEEFERAAYTAESLTFGYDFEQSFWGERPSSRMMERKKSTVARLVEMGALAPSAAAGGEWKVNEAIKDRLLAAARVAEACGWETPRNALCDNRWRATFAVVGWPGRELVDCVFGNPFQPVSLDPAYRTSTVAALAARMYETRDFTPMPILGDALQDAGCPDESPLVAHCRGPRSHARGCWVVDLILGKA